MNEQNPEQLQGMCQHGNNQVTCVICEKEKVAGTFKNKVSNFVRIKYKRFVEPTVQKINTARGKPTAESITSQLENSVPLDFDKFMVDLPKEDKKTGINERGELKNWDEEK